MPLTKSPTSSFSSSSFSSFYLISSSSFSSSLMPLLLFNPTVRPHFLLVGVSIFLCTASEWSLLLNPTLIILTLPTGSKLVFSSYCGICIMFKWYEQRVLIHVFPVSSIVFFCTGFGWFELRCLALVLLTSSFSGICIMFK